VVGGCGVCSTDGDGRGGGGSRMMKGDVSVMGDAGYARWMTGDIIITRPRDLASTQQTHTRH
jgi:formylmethanofuran dehydrogenase subunit C